VSQPGTIAVLLFIVAVIAVASLVSGASYLEILLPGGLPLGNVLSAIGLCAIAGAAVVLSARGTVQRRVSVAALIGAVAWLPVSIALAGNLTLNFHGGRGDAWLVFSFAVIVAVLGALIWALAASLLARHRRTPDLEPK
jgi:hypothetical protein